MSYFGKIYAIIRLPLSLNVKKANLNIAEMVIWKIYMLERQKFLKLIIKRISIVLCQLSIHCSKYKIFLVSCFPFLYILSSLETMHILGVTFILQPLKHALVSDQNISKLMAFILFFLRGRGGGLEGRGGGKYIAFSFHKGNTTNMGIIY